MNPDDPYSNREIDVSSATLSSLSTTRSQITATICGVERVPAAQCLITAAGSSAGAVGTAGASAAGASTIGVG